MFRRAITASLIVLLFGVMSFGQNRQNRASNQPAPRWPDGHVNLGTFPGEKGHWIRQGRAQLASNPESIIAAGPGGLSNNLKLMDVPFQLWARALYEYRQTNFECDAPHSRCNRRRVRARSALRMVLKSSKCPNS